MQRHTAFDDIVHAMPCQDDVVKHLIGAGASLQYAFAVYANRTRQTTQPYSPHPCSSSPHHRQQISILACSLIVPDSRVAFFSKHMNHNASLIASQSHRIELEHNVLATQSTLIDRFCTIHGDATPTDCLL